MSFKCLHIADIHFRGLTRHEEYRASFNDLYRQARELKPDVIYVGGDIVHSKTQGISPELIDVLSWWFTSLADIAPTHVILGNHDGLILNKDRQDAISPIISALGNPNIFLYKESGTYPTGVPGFNWCVFSCFDEERWEGVTPVPDEINIALFHGAVWGSKTDIDWDIEGDTDVAFFKDYDFAFLGDIHKKQYLDDRKTVAYCGSTIQQNYGEDPGKGFLFWEIEDKDNFDSTFYPVAHSKPFVTINWAGSVQATLDNAEAGPDGSRFRVRTTSPISQVEIKQLHASLKEFKNASEIVYKHDHDVLPSLISTTGEELINKDLRDSKTHIKLMKDFYRDHDLSDIEWAKLDDLTNKYLNQLAHNDAARNIKWSVKKLEFDNIFAYGKGNVIDFTKLGGITGIFGPNRSGKSSIAGSIMYALYNTTDRGPIKNIHIINSRKGYCQAKVTISVNGCDYRIERQSVKHETRKGLLHAVTHLNVLVIDDCGNIVRDMTEEQRRESEKVVRGLVGTSEDFLLTSLASQGEMNTFLKYKATQRKSILSSFLDLNIFEGLSTLAKEDSAVTRALLKGAPDREWDVVILEKETERSRKSNDRDLIDVEISKLRLRLQELNISLATHKDKDIITKSDVMEQQEKIDQVQEKRELLLDKSKTREEEIQAIISKLKKIKEIKSQFPIDVLKEKFEAQQDLEKSIVILVHNLEKEKTLLKNQKKSVDKLSDVPCGDKFPTCKFIKDSHKNKLLLDVQLEKINSLSENASATQRSLSILKKDSLVEKIEKYDEVLHQQSQLKIDMSKQTLLLHSLQTETKTIDRTIEEGIVTLNDMHTRVTTDESSSEVNDLKRILVELNDKINMLDSKRMQLSESIGLFTSDIQKLKDEQDEYSGLTSQWKTYELFMNAVSKKGIPLQIISAQLPVINSEITKILHDVVGFNIELEADPNSNAMDIYINYGDSRRIIECASGMEKMVASLAIRVALINVSSLPKTDLLIIDEGFGALDEMNIEACNRLLISLKKWFKNILVISHVDGVKDVVDNVLDISRINSDSGVIYE